MGLNSFGGDDDTSNSGSSKKYERVTLEEMEDFFDSLPYTFEKVQERGTKEVVFETKDVLGDNSTITLRVYSTIDERTGVARKKGADAIRTVLWHTHAKTPVGGRTKTLRIPTWRKNLRGKINSIIEETQQYVTKCDECGSFMIEKSGRYGDFLGCIQYPDCNNTEDLEDG